MKNKNFSSTILVDKSPKEVFKTLLNVRAWWSGFYSEQFEGSSKKLNDEFSFRAGDGIHYSKQRLVELIPDKRVAWLVIDSELTFLKKKNEWNDTRLIFDISEKGTKTQVRFSHEGLVPEIECYNSCSPAWTMYIQEKLSSLLTNRKTQKEKK